jgi:hypothetical protein
MLFVLVHCYVDLGNSFPRFHILFESCLMFTGYSDFVFTRLPRSSKVICIKMKICINQSKGHLIWMMGFYTQTFHHAELDSDSYLRF